jgi:hypothetical protein
LSNPPATSRALLHFSVAVETTKGEDELQRLMSWVQDRMLNATRNPRDGQFIAIALTDGDQKIIRMTTHGTASGETSDLVEEMFDSN